MAPSIPNIIAENYPLVRQTWPGSVNHLLALILCAGVILLLVALGQNLRHHGQERRLRLALGVAGLISWCLITGYYLLPSQFDPAESFPLHVCDIGNLVAGLMMLLTATRARPAFPESSVSDPFRPMRSMLYFWGFALTSQGFITPVVEEGLGDPRYWLFWMNHTVVVGYAIYDVVVGGYRPRFIDLLIASAITAGYVALVLPIDLAGGWNYGFVGRSVPDSPTLIDLLGPWPLRILWLCCLGFVAFLLAYLPWPIAQSAGGFRRRGGAT